MLDEVDGRKALRRQERRWRALRLVPRGWLGSTPDSQFERALTALYAAGVGLPIAAPLITSGRRTCVRTCDVILTRMRLAGAAKLSGGSAGAALSAGV